MKYIILIGDGMADRPLEELGGRTPLEAARIPNLDRLAREGSLGLAQTVPEGFPPGSDVANLTVLGYPCAEFYTGRAPLEAANMGVELGPADVAYRCNLVTLADKEGEGPVMEDFSAGHIDSAAACELIRELDEKLGGDRVRFYPGVSYRHLMVWRGGLSGADCTPPHDISGRKVDEYRPRGEGAGFLRDLTERAAEVLAVHPLNRERIGQGKRPATHIWLWGQGKAPRLPSLQERYGLKGALISAVDLLKGIGVYLGMTVVNVPGATGYLDTNYAGKARAAVEALEEHDLVYLHLEAPDEAGHNGDLAAKIEAVEAFDGKIVGPVLEHLSERGDFRLLALPDHATPVSIKTHSREAVPFVVYPGGPQGKRAAAYTEREAAAAGLWLRDGCSLINRFLGRAI